MLGLILIGYVVALVSTAWWWCLWESIDIGLTNSTGQTVRFLADWQNPTREHWIPMSLYVWYDVRHMLCKFDPSLLRNSAEAGVNFGARQFRQRRAKESCSCCSEIQCISRNGLLLACWDSLHNLMNNLSIAQCIRGSAMRFSQIISVLVIRGINLFEQFGVLAQLGVAKPRADCMVWSFRITFCAPARFDFLSNRVAGLRQSQRSFHIELPSSYHRAWSLVWKGTRNPFKHNNYVWVSPFIYYFLPCILYMICIYIILYTKYIYIVYV